MTQFDYETPLKKLSLTDYEYCLKKFCTNNATITINQFKEALKEINYNMAQDLVRGDQMYTMMVDRYFHRGYIKSGSGISPEELSHVQERIRIQLEEMKLPDFEFNYGHFAAPQMDIDPLSIQPTVRVAPPKTSSGWRGGE